MALKNYGLSMTSVPFVNFAVAAAIGESPGSVAATWMGASCRDLVGLLTGASRMTGSAMKARVAVMAGGSLSLVLVIGLIGRRINSQLKALEEAEGASSEAPGEGDLEDAASPTAALLLERRGPARSASKQKLSEDFEDGRPDEESFFLGSSPGPLSPPVLQ